MSDAIDEGKFELLATLGEVYGKEFSPEALELMVRGLSKIPLADLQIAVDMCLRSSKYMPTVSELIEAAEKFGSPYRNPDRIRQLTVEESQEFIRSLDQDEDDFHDSVSEGRA